MRAEGNVAKPLRLIVGGGIGSGKSTVLRMLEELGACVIEADRIGHQILEPGGAVHAEVAARWPDVVEHGRINRKLLASIVFSDADQLAALEAMTHPHIGEAIRGRAEAAGDRDVAVELPIGSEMLGPEWTLVVVAVPEDVRMQRSLARGGDPADVARRMDSQLSDAEWETQADHIVSNVGTVAELEAAVLELWQQLHRQP